MGYNTEIVAETEIQKKVKDILEDYLKEKMHRRTPERFAILNEIYSYEGHFDIDTLYMNMQEKYRVSRATLYNTMELLLDCNLVRKHQFGKNISLYEKAYESRQHDHIIIEDTNEVIEFCDPRIQNIKSTLEEVFDIDINRHSLYFYGTRKNKK